MVCYLTSFPHFPPYLQITSDISQNVKFGLPGFAEGLFNASLLRSMNFSFRLQQKEQEHCILRRVTFLPSILHSEPPPQTWLKMNNFTKIKNKEKRALNTYSSAINFVLIFSWEKNTRSRYLSFWEQNKVSVSNLKAPLSSQFYTDCQKHSAWRVRSGYKLFPPL